VRDGASYRVRYKIKWCFYRVQQKHNPVSDDDDEVGEIPAECEQLKILVQMFIYLFIYLFI